MTRKTYDVIVVGGGVMGCSLAHHLMAAERGLRLLVVERDPTYARASTTLSLGNVRIQFGLKENVQISQHTLEVLERFAEEMAVDGWAPDVGFRREGNLFLADEVGRAATQRAFALQTALGCDVQWFSPQEIEERYPLFRVEGLIGGTFSARDGHLDGHALLMGYRAKALSRGAALLHDEVIEIETEPRRVVGVRTASGRRLAAPVVVNCAGAWAPALLEKSGAAIPVVPVKRQVFLVRTAVEPGEPLPLTCLPSGLYFRSEGAELVLVGRSLPEDPVAFDLGWEEGRLTEILWPELAAFVPDFDRLRLVRGWAGLYAVNTFDGNAILGEWPELRGLFLANGFSGHGLQQAPAVGRYLCELITGQVPILDLSVFGPQRILEGEPLCESALV